MARFYLKFDDKYIKLINGEFNLTEDKSDSTVFSETDTSFRMVSSLFNLQGKTLIEEPISTWYLVKSEKTNSNSETVISTKILENISDNAYEKYMDKHMLSRYDENYKRIKDSEKYIYVDNFCCHFYQLLKYRTAIFTFENVRYIVNLHKGIIYVYYQDQKGILNIKTYNLIEESKQYPYFFILKIDHDSFIDTPESIYKTFNSISSIKKYIDYKELDFCHHCTIGNVGLRFLNMNENNIHFLTDDGDVYSMSVDDIFEVEW